MKEVYELKEYVTTFKGSEKFSYFSTVGIYSSLNKAKEAIVGGNFRVDVVGNTLIYTNSKGEIRFKINSRLLDHVKHEVYDEN